MTDGTGKGFTLIELMIVIFIVAVLLTVSLPTYQRQLRDTRRALATAELMKVMLRQEQYFLDHKQFAETLTELGLPASPYALDSDGKVVLPTAEQRIYLVELTAQQFSYVLYARPQLSQGKEQLCGTLSLDSKGVKAVTGTGSALQCW